MTVKELLHQNSIDLIDEPIAWESTTLYYKKYITESRYQKLDKRYRKWYKPYLCSHCKNNRTLCD